MVQLHFCQFQIVETSVVYSLDTKNKNYNDDEVLGLIDKNIFIDTKIF